MGIISWALMPPDAGEAGSRPRSPVAKAGLWEFRSAETREADTEPPELSSSSQLHSHTEPGGKLLPIPARKD